MFACNPVGLPRRNVEVKPPDSKLRAEPHTSPGTMCLVCNCQVDFVPIRISQDKFFGTRLDGNGKDVCRHIHKWRRLNRNEQLPEEAEVRNLTKVREDAKEEVVYTYVWSTTNKEFRGQPSPTTREREARRSGLPW